MTPEAERLSTQADEMERRAAERVPPSVAAALSACYTPDEVADVYRALGRIHTRRLARVLVRAGLRAGKSVGSIIPEIAISVGMSEGWVDRALYPRGRP